MITPSRRNEAPRKAVVLLLVTLVSATLVVSAVVARASSSAGARAAGQYTQVPQPTEKVARPTVAFVGDSYSAGAGSTGYNSRFTTLVAAYEGWASSNFAYGGTGYLRAETTNARTGCGVDYCPRYADALDRVVAYNPSIVFVSGGRNDVGLPQAEVDDAIRSFFAELRRLLPNARVIVTSPTWAYSSPPAQLARIRGTVEREARRIGATYLDVGEPLVADSKFVGSDRVHPNNRGHAELARIIEVRLSRATQSQQSNASLTSTK